MEFIEAREALEKDLIQKMNQKILDYDFVVDQIILMIKGNYSKDAQKELHRGLNKLTLTELVLLQKMIREKLNVK